MALDFQTSIPIVDGTSITKEEFYKQYYIPANDKDFIRMEEIRNLLQEQV